PQVAGLGMSATSRRYSLTGLEEARAYLAHPLLGPRLREAVTALLDQRAGASAVLGELDALKFRSSMTLFALADPAEPIFTRALERFFGGEADPRTRELLNAPGPDS